MASEWGKVPLGELYDFSSGLSKPQSEFGFGQGFLSLKDVFYNYFTPPKLEQLVNSTEKEQQLYSIKRGDVFLIRTSETMDELGMSCVALWDYNRATFNGFPKRLRPKSSAQIIPEYAGYFFRSPSFRREVTAMSSLSTRASLNNEMLGRLTMALPPLVTKEKIGTVLKALDDKIELNRRMNAKLEEMARALFQRWFVDFDPVRAKLDGRQPVGLDPATAALFPDSFQDSEAGHIPKGWTVRPLSSHACYLSRGIGPSYLEQGGVCVLNQKCVRDHRVDFSKSRRHDSAKKPINGRALQLYDVLVNSTGMGTLGRVAQVLCLPEEVIVDSHVTIVRAEADTDAFFLGINLTDREAEIEELGEGSTGQTELSRVRLGELKVIAPPFNLQKAFGVSVGPLLKRMSGNETQSRTLASLRDTLLPKLLCGELKVPNLL